MGQTANTDASMLMKDIDHTCPLAVYWGQLGSVGVSWGQLGSAGWILTELWVRFPNPFPALVCLGPKGPCLTPNLPLIPPKQHNTQLPLLSMVAVVEIPGHWDEGGRHGANLRFRTRGLALGLMCMKSPNREPSHVDPCIRLGEPTIPYPHPRICPPDFLPSVRGSPSTARGRWTGSNSPGRTPG